MDRQSSKTRIGGAMLLAAISLVATLSVALVAETSPPK
jgi:hypothetical protein